MTTKFNKDMYAKMRAKKDELLSNIGKKAVRITGRGSPAVPVTSITLVMSRAQTRTRRRLILARQPSGVTRDWPWTRLMGLSLLTTSRFSPGCPPTLWPAIIFTDLFR